MEDSESALDKLREVEPSNFQEITALQNEIRVAEKALLWINNAISVGKMALEQLEIESEE
jgi:hypothetical protein